MSDKPVYKCDRHPDYDPIINPPGGCEICYEVYEGALRRLEEIRRDPNHPLRHHLPKDPQIDRWLDEGGTPLS